MHIIIILAVIFGANLALGADDVYKATYEAEIDAEIDAVWEAFTREEILIKWMAPMAEIDLKVGGTIRTNYDPSGTIGDPNTIENTILSYDTNSMISLKTTSFPANFPFKDAARDTWSVFYFEELPGSRTRIKIVGLGYTLEDSSQKMRSFFASGNKRLIDKLNTVLKSEKK